MIAITRGIVLHTTDFSETSVIAKIYTERYGMQSYMINGVRKAKSKFKANLLQPLTLVELVAHQKENRDIQRISDIVASPPLLNIADDIIKSSVAFFIAEVIYKSVKEEETNENLFPFLFHHVELLDNAETSCRQFHHYFLMQLTKHLGFFPAGVYSSLNCNFDLRNGVHTSAAPSHFEFVSGKEAEALYKISNTTFEKHHLIELTTAERKQLLKNILFYYELHALHGAKINSHKILEEVLE